MSVKIQYAKQVWIYEVKLDKLFMFPPHLNLPPGERKKKKNGTREDESKIFQLNTTLNSYLFFRIDHHATFVTPDEDENQDSTCHGMSLN